LIVAHTPPVHLPLQHCPSPRQFAPTFVHAPATHAPVALQKPEQHWLAVEHIVAEPVTMHGPARLPHWFGA